ncbi:hypothetical protein DE146DRAFT_638100 [Phaeosphaeria sp. MPI-PUGE-AT-0046c]|nr:hypothetical protein DE146DRAFT_638100 [Phaeosphaeria sp. MPI-PUGE-AT-0046c]
MTMDQPDMSSDPEAHPKDGELPLTQYTGWTNRVFEDHGGSAEAQGYADGHTKDFPAWNNATDSGSYVEQATTAASGSWSTPNESIDDSFFENTIIEPLEMAYNNDFPWLPPGYAPHLDTEGQSWNLDVSQVQNELPWTCSLPETSPKSNVAVHHAQKHIAIEDAPTFDADSSDNDDSETAIGTAMKNGRFKCNMVQCGTKSYKRLGELRRHYNTRHAAQKPEFWCKELHCDRSAAEGGRPFHRKYRLQDHMRKLHSGGRNELSDDEDQVGE